MEKIFIENENFDTENGFNASKKRIFRPQVLKHPLGKGYMVSLRYSMLPPYFGTLKECNKACKFLTNKLLNEGYTFVD